METKPFDPSTATREELLEKLMGIGEMMRANQKNETEKKLRNYRELNAVAKKGQILFTGSSLMEMFPVAEYCASLGVEKTVYNRGIGGTTTDDFLRNIDTVLFDLEPGKIFINIGTNDINAQLYGDGWQEHIIENYRRILTQIKERLPGAKVYIMAFYPVNEEAWAANPWAKNAFGTRTNENVSDTNAKLLELASEYGVNYIDVNQGIKDSLGRLRADITMEGIHMYAGGYLPVFRALRKYIEE